MILNWKSKTGIVSVHTEFCILAACMFGRLPAAVRCNFDHFSEVCVRLLLLLSALVGAAKPVSGGSTYTQYRALVREANGAAADFP